eukprot:1265145-Rhodomonas_salina.2
MRCLCLASRRSAGGCKVGSVQGLGSQGCNAKSNPSLPPSSYKVEGHEIELERAMHWQADERVAEAAYRALEQLELLAPERQRATSIPDIA